MYTTKCTYLGAKLGWGCRVFHDGELVIEAIAPERILIGPIFRDLLRTLDKGGGDKFTYAARERKFKEGNICVSVKHIWNRS